MDAPTSSRYALFNTLGEAFNDRRLWRKGEDERAIGYRRLAHHIEPHSFAQPHELLGAEWEYCGNGIDHQMIVEDGVASYAPEFLRDGQLSGRDWAMDKNEVHPADYGYTVRAAAKMPGQS